MKTKKLLILLLAVCMLLSAVLMMGNTAGAETTIPNYLHFTSLVDGSKVQLNQSGYNITAVVQYSENGIDWSEYTFTQLLGGKLGFEIPLKKGETVYFRAGGTDNKNETFSVGNGFFQFSFGENSSIAADGNTMSLLDASMQQTSVPDYAFKCLFMDCTALVSAPELPATELGKYCYESMFEGCTNLTKVHDLNVTKVDQYCFAYMFHECSKLVVHNYSDGCIGAKFSFPNMDSEPDNWNQQMFYECRANYDIKCGCNYCVSSAYFITNGTPSTASESNHGYVTVVNEAYAGDTITVNVSPAEGYELDTLKYNDGTNDTAIQAAEGVYTFAMPAKAVTVTATFKQTEKENCIYVNAGWAGRTAGDEIDGKVFGTNAFATIQDAVNAIGVGDAQAAKSGTVMMLSNSQENVVISQYQDITLDLNGYVLKAAADGSAVITVGQNNSSSAKLTINDSGSTAVHYFTYMPDGAWTLYEGEGAPAENVIDLAEFSLEKVKDTSKTYYIKVSGGCITGGNNASGNGGGVLNQNGTLNLQAGNIIGNAAQRGGGVYTGISSGTSTSTFTMYGGTIAGNMSSAFGGGVCNRPLSDEISSSEGFTFTMSGGTIAGNSCVCKIQYAIINGGGVFNNGTFNFSAGSIASNTVKTSDASESHGGGVSLAGGTLTMSGTASISGNYCVLAGSTSGGSFGGGVYNLSATITMKDSASISGNACTIYVAGGSAYGGGVCNEGALAMSGNASISGNTCKMNDESSLAGGGGGVTNSNLTGREVSPTLTMSDNASITGNEAMYAGGVINGVSGTITMSDSSSILKNTADMIGGVWNPGTLTMSGSSSISDNADTHGIVGGVYMDPDENPVMNVGGAVKVAGNTAGNKEVNVYLSNGKTVTISSVASLTKGASIGVTTEIAPTEESPVKFTTNGTDDDVQYFFSDDSKYYVNFVDKTDETAAHLELAIKQVCYIDVGGDGSFTDGTDTKYETITAALAVEKSNTETADKPMVIRMIADSEENVTIASDRFITLDLNGYVLSGTGTSTVIDNRGNLTVIDSGKDKVHYFKVNQNGLWVLDKTATEEDYTFSPADGLKTTDGKATSVLPVENKIIKVSGGVITGGKATSYGGGVINDGSSAVFTLSSGSIIGNAASDGGGIKNEKTLNLNGGAIAGNTASSTGGGVYNNETVNLTGTVILCNKAGTNGGGIYNHITSTLTISDTAEIILNTAQSAGGGVYNYKGTPATEEMVAMPGGKMIINGGKISGNTANGIGGGVFVATNATFTMNGGTISGNTAAKCGGIYTENGCTVNLLGGTITGNNATTQFGGVMLNCSNGKTYTIGGNIKIYGNTLNSTTQDDLTLWDVASAPLVISSSTPLVTTGDYKAKIYISLQDYEGNDKGYAVKLLDSPNSGKITNPNSTDYSGCFYCDDTNYKAYNDGTGESQVVTLGLHQHTWSFTASKSVDTLTYNDTITASCTDDCTYAGSDTSLTITAPTNLTYNAKENKATFGSTATTFLGGALPNITYEYKATSDGTYASTTDTIKAGYYKASFTVGTGEGAKTAYVEYEIEKATLTVTGTAADGKTYDGTTTATVNLGNVSGKIKDTDDVTVSASGTFADKNAGKGKTVNITYSLSGDDKDNYKVSGNTETTANITKKSLTISNAVIEDKIYDGKTNATVTSVTFDGLVGDETLTKDTHYTVSGVFDNANATGTNAATKVTVTVTLNSTEAANNYEISGTFYVDKTISKATQTVSAPTASEVGETSVTLETQSGQGNTKYGYSTTNSVPEDWQDSAEFTGLTPGGTYYFFVKFEGNDNYEEKISEGTKITVDFCQYYTTLNDSDKAQTLVLGENVAGDYIITKVNCGYTIQTTEGKYIALSSDGKSIIEQSESYTWSYDGGLYNTVKTTTTTRVVFWKWFAVKTTNSYLTVNENKELAVSSSSVTAQILVTGTHEWAYSDNGDGNTHSVYCKNCYTVKGDEDHKYGDDDCCEKCGAYNPEKAGVTGITVKESKSVAARGFWFWTRSNAYIYTISPTLNHVTAKQVQYSLNQSTWTTGCSILSDTKLSTFYIRVTDSNGKTTIWKYVNGNVTKEN